MKISIGRYTWGASYVWIEKGRLCWLSLSGRKHSRKITMKTSINVQRVWGTSGL